MTDQQRTLAVAAAVVVGLFVVLRIAVAVRNRRRRGKKVTSAVLAGRKAVPREDKEVIGETVAAIRGSAPPLDVLAGATGKLGYLSLTRDHLVFVPYRTQQPVVLRREALSDPRTRARKVWKKRRARFTLAYEGSAITFDVKGPYHWMAQFGFRSGFEGAELTGGQFGPGSGL